MTRRAAICTIACSRALLAANPGTFVELLEPLASGLSEGNPDIFLSNIHKTTPQRELLETNVRALIQNYEITCSISVLKVDGDWADVDWYLELRDKATQTVAERRRATLRVHAAKGRLDSIAPVDFFKATRE